MLTGGCHCGALRYEAQGPIDHATYCHCTDCQRSTGAPVVAWFAVPRENFRFTAGAPAHYRSSAHATRSFCPACGAQLAFADDDAPLEIDIATASLDDPAAVPPADHIYTRSQISWVAFGDGLPRFPGSRAKG